jgi:5'-3' exoribonuclease 2
MRETENISYLCVDNLKKAIINELKIKWNIPDDCNTDDLIESYCVMCSILGNDFIPHQLTLNLKDNGLDKLVEITGNAIKTFGLLVNNNKINHDCLTEIFEKIALTEDKDIVKEVQKYLAKKAFSSVKSEEYAIKHKDNLALLINSSEITKWRHLYYKHIFNINISFNRNIINDACYNYIKGIYWTYNYYKRFNIDHEWYYQFNYPPASKDIANYIKVNTDYEIKQNGTFINNDVQLLLILPKYSIELISDKNKKYMTDISAGLLHMYPESFKIQTFLKTHLWECCPILPTINLHKIIDKNK